MSEAEVPDAASSHRLLRLLGRALLFLLVFEIIAVVVFRTHWRPGIDTVRRFNKRLLNPLMLKMAGKPHWYASVVHHVGRSSGKSYSTPVWAERVGPFLFIPLAYGVDVDWNQNILVAGTCTVDWHGERLETAQPVVVPAEEAERDLPWRARTRYRAYGVEHFLRLNVTNTKQAAA